MNVALFGGTFDPIHRGHLAVAKAAQREYGIKQVLFVPSGAPPHKSGQTLTPFIHRYAMVAMATAGEEGLVASLLESPEALGDNPAYSIDTVRRVRAGLKRNDRLFFIIGIDAFLDLAKWREPVALLRETEFIVASRPGYSLGDIGDALPAGLASARAGETCPEKASGKRRSSTAGDYDPSAAGRERTGFGYADTERRGEKGRQSAEAGGTGGR